MSEQHSHTRFPVNAFNGSLIGYLTVAALTDTGNLRENNEDSYSVSAERGLLMVSDGMGGHNAGAIASQLVVESLTGMIESQISSQWPPDVSAQMDIIRNLFVTLSREVWEHSRGRAGLAGMGATVVLALFVDERAFIAHMGDSRAYLYRDHVLKQLTDDHSVIALLLGAGEITEEEAATHPARGVLSRYVGMDREVYPDVQNLDLVPGDRLLLCTDGLTGELTDETIAGILSERSDVQEACGMLIDEAKKGPARDNITVVLAEWSVDSLEDIELEAVSDEVEVGSEQRS